jgi:hypothetical protein
MADLRISKKTGEIIRPRTKITRPSPSQISTWKKKNPELLFKDSKGRIYGRREDPTEFEEDEETWFVQCPTTPHNAAADEVVDFPSPDARVRLENLKTKDVKEVLILYYPEKIVLGAKTASVNVRVYTN